jgi:hypothetical protein
MPGSMPSRASVLQATMRGLQIPGNENAAMLWNKGMGEEINREDVQAARKEDIAARLAEHRITNENQLNFQKSQLEAQMSDKSLSREQLGKYQLMHDATLKEIARIHADAITGSKDQAQTLRNETLHQQRVEHLSKRAEPISAMMASAQQVQDMFDSYTDPNTGKLKNIPGIGLGVGALPNAMLTAEGSSNRQKLQMFKNAMVRAQAGLSQTVSEQTNAGLEMLMGGQFRQDELHNAWKNMQTKLNTVPDTIKAGYKPEVVDTYLARGGGGLDHIKSNFKLGQAPAKSIQNELRKAPTSSGLTPAEQAELDSYRKGQ